jgi:hypothetical protein
MHALAQSSVDGRRTHAGEVELNLCAVLREELYPASNAELHLSAELQTPGPGTPGRLSLNVSFS